MGYPSLPRLRLTREDFPRGAPDEAADAWALAMQERLAAEALSALEAAGAGQALLAGPVYTNPFKTPTAKRGASLLSLQLHAATASREWVFLQIPACAMTNFAELFTAQHTAHCKLCHARDGGPVELHHELP